MFQKFTRSAQIALLCLSVVGGLAVGSSIQFTHAGEANSRDWDTADRETQRLAPSAFPDLPEPVARELSARGCLVPQAWYPETPHNVISGAFQRPGQIDWAVLCSVERRSVILVFWNGSAERVEEVPRSAGADRNWLQGISGERIGFSRLIRAVGKNDIHDHNGGPDLPPIDHEGIDDAFIEKASSVNYWQDGRWLELPGTD